MPFNHYLPGSFHGYLRYQEMKVNKKNYLLSHFYTLKYSNINILLSSSNTQLYESRILISPILGVAKCCFLYNELKLAFWDVFWYKSKFLFGKNTKEVNKWIFGIMKIGCSMSWTKYKWRNKSTTAFQIENPSWEAWLRSNSLTLYTRHRLCSLTSLINW